MRETAKIDRINRLTVVNTCLLRISVMDSFVCFVRNEIPVLEQATAECSVSLQRQYSYPDEPPLPVCVCVCGGGGGGGGGARETETNRDKQRQTETDRDRQPHAHIERGRETERQRRTTTRTHRKRERDRDRERQTDRQTEGERQRDRDREKQREIERERLPKRLGRHGYPWIVTHSGPEGRIKIPGPVEGLLLVWPAPLQAANIAVSNIRFGAACPVAAYRCPAV